MAARIRSMGTTINSAFAVPARDANGVWAKLEVPNMMVFLG
jgi:hypothetical protein